MTVISMEGHPKHPAEKVFRGAWRAAGIALLVTLLLLLAWLVRSSSLYDAGSDLGYNLGLVGGLLMLSLLLYPLRKRMGFLERLGGMNGWFRYHMVAGIAGPLLVLFHSTFKTGSLNGAMALYSMLLVVASGIVGRFIYRHIHRGLYGQQLTLADVSEDLKTSADSMGSVFALCADIEPRLLAFKDMAFDTSGGIAAKAWMFVTLRWRGRLLARELREDAKSALRSQWRQQGGSRSIFVMNYRLAREDIDHYLDTVIKASQLKVWERIFSYWHVVHVPFLYLLVFSGVVHVVAVHMY